AKTTQERPMKTVLCALALGESASEAEALSAVTKLQDGGKALLTLTGKASHDEAVATISGWKIAAEEVSALRETLAKQKAEADAKEFDAAIAEAKGKRLLAASDEHKRNKAALAFKGAANAMDSLRSFLSAFDPLIEVPKVAAAAAVE